MAGSSTSSRTGGGDPPIPRHVELLIAWTNSEDHEEGTDDLTTPAELTRWLVKHRLLSRGVGADTADLVLARRLREGLHSALVANHDESGDYHLLEEVGAALPLALSAPGGRLGLRPVDAGVRGALALLLVAVQEALADDTWRRLKICSADDCRWAYVDTTKNQSRTWCEWGCGNKAKTRAYRARKKAAGRAR